MGIITSILALYGLSLGTGAAGAYAKSVIGPAAHDGDIVPASIRNRKSPYGGARVKCAYIKKSNGICTALIVMSPGNVERGWVTADSLEELEEMVAREYEKIEEEMK